MARPEENLCVTIGRFTSIRDCPQASDDRAGKDSPPGDTTTSGVKDEIVQRGGRPLVIALLKSARARTVKCCCATCPGLGLGGKTA